MEEEAIVAASEGGCRNKERRTYWGEWSIEGDVPLADSAAMTSPLTLHLPHSVLLSLLRHPPPFAGSDDGSERARGSGEMNLGLGFWLPDICLGWDQLRPSIRLDGPVLSCVGPPHGLSAKSQMGQFQMLDAPRMTSDLSH